jgi:nucleoside 2-deoxyribosyltransferase
MVPSIYVASPLGFSEAGRYFYYKELVPRLNCLFTVIDPWRLTEPKIIDIATRAPEGPRQRKAWEYANRVIGLNNENGIRRGQFLLGILDGSDVDSGTASEIAFGASLGKLIEAYRSDFRLAGDNIGSRVNLQVEHWVRKGGGVISATLDDLITALRARVRLIYRIERLRLRRGLPAIPLS